MNAPDFHARRLTGIGGSDCAPALGLSPWKSPLQLYLEKIGETPPAEENEAMHFGTVLEPIVRAEYVRRTDRSVAIPPQLRHPVHGFMVAHLDGITSDDRVLECKTARFDRGWGEPGTDDVPQAYLLQATHCMIVAELAVADIAVLIGGSDFRVYTIPRKPELVELVIEGERLFWQAVQERAPPAPTTLAEINLRWRNSQARTVELPPNVAKACERLAELRERMKGDGDEAEKCEALVKLELTDADVGTIDGVPAVTWKQAKPSTVFDSKRFRDERPEVAAEYESERPGSRRFLLKL